MKPLMYGLLAAMGIATGATVALDAVWLLRTGSLAPAGGFVLRAATHSVFLALACVIVCAHGALARS